jgi:hypothetical protein
VSDCTAVRFCVPVVRNVCAARAKLEIRIRLAVKTNLRLL